VSSSKTKNKNGWKPVRRTQNFCSQTQQLILFKDFCQRRSKHFVSLLDKYLIFQKNFHRHECYFNNIRFVVPFQNFVYLFSLLLFHLIFFTPDLFDRYFFRVKLKRKLTLIQSYLLEFGGLGEQLFLFQEWARIFFINTSTQTYPLLPTIMLGC
jgi:hypothetical protein